MSSRIVVFGATGATASHIVRLGLESGATVRAHVRSPDKLPEQVRAHPRFELVQGDFSESAKIRSAIEGMDAVLIAAGNKGTSKKSLFMLALVKDVVAGMRAHGVRRLVFQGGATTYVPGKPTPWSHVLVFRPMITMLGWSGTMRDNDAVAAWLTAECADLDWTFLRPAMIRDRPSEGTVVGSASTSQPVNFVDLAQFHLDTVRQRSHVREFPWVAYA